MRSERSKRLRVYWGLFLCACAGCSPKPPAPHSAPAERAAPSPPVTASVKFTDITAAAGLHFLHQSARTPRRYFVEIMGSGGAFLDYDGDGWQDILLINNAPLPGGRVVGQPRMALYHNNHNGKFTDVTHAAGLDRTPMYGMGVSVGDYDNDGKEDFYVSCVLGPGHLFHNEGRGRFRDVTEQAGVANKGRWGTSCAWLDYNGDGRLDLFICNYVKYGSLQEDIPCYDSDKHYIYCIPTTYESSHCVLYRNEGNGRFTDVTASSGIGAARGKSLGVTVWDYDNDGRPDIFVANDTVAGFLFHNEGNGTFKEVGLETGLAVGEDGNPHSGMGIAAADTQNNGKMSLAITNFQGVQTTFYNQVAPQLFRDDRIAAGIGRATDQTLGFGVLFFDYDNDGYQDLLQVNGHVQDEIERRQANVHFMQPTLLFHNQQDGTFSEVGLKSGLPFSQPIVGRGCAWGDIDNDGRLDALITVNDGPAMLWRNETPTQNHWLTFKLEGVRSNRDGIGAMILVKAGGVTQRATVQSGSSYLSQSDLRPHFGLGAQTSADVEIHWPSGAVDKIASIACGRIWTLREGAHASR